MTVALSLDFVERPLLLALVVVLPVFFLLLLRRSRRQRQERLARLGAAEVVRRLVPPTAFGGTGWRAARLGLAAALAGVAVAGPRWGYERTLVRSSGVDLVLAVDASLSLLATDERPSRLERVKQEIRRLRALSPEALAQRAHQRHSFRFHFRHGRACPLSWRRRWRTGSSSG